MNWPVQKCDRPFKLGKRYLWSFFLVVVVIDLVLALSLFTVFSGIQISKTTDYSVAQLDQVCTSTDVLYQSLEAVSNQLISDSDTYSALLSTRMDRRQEAKACAKLKSMKSAIPYLRYITLYNLASDRFMSNSCVGTGAELEADSLYERLGEQARVCFVRKIGTSYNIQPDKRATVYTFVFRMNIKPDGSSDLAVLDVNDSYFTQVLSNLRVAEGEQNLILADEQGQVITGMAAGINATGLDYGTFVPAPAFEDLNIWDITAQSSSSGSLTLQNGPLASHFVVYAKAAIAGWTIVNVLPYSTVLTGIGLVAFLTGSMALVTMGFGFFLARRMSRQLYAPIQILYQNYVSAGGEEEKGNELELLSRAFSDMYSKADRLEQGLISSFNESKNLYLRYLLQGESKKVKGALGVYERLHINLSSPYYSVVILECVPQHPEQEEKQANLFISYYALENITGELISASCDMEFLRWEENVFAVLLYLPTDTLPEGLHSGLTRISQVMSKEFHMDCTLCVGKTVTAWQNLNLCYEQALIAMGARSITHQGQVFYSSETTSPFSADVYYNDLHKKMADYVREGDGEACSREFDTALSTMENISFKAAKAYFRHVLMSVLDSFSASFDREDLTFAALMGQLEEIDESQNVCSLRSYTLSFLSELMHRLEVNRKSSNQAAALRAKAVIDQNYANPDLSLGLLADMVGLSPAYLGKVFTSVTTFSFNDYLNFVRMEQACSLLKTTKLPVSKISETVGILNTNYFYAIFKKRFSTTPSAFRKNEPSPP